MAIVVANENNYALHPKTRQPFLLPFGKGQFYIPESAIVSYPKRANRLPDGVALGQALATKAPEKWASFLDPDCLVQVRGTEGTSVYTTFEIPDHPNEVRFLRHVSAVIAEKCLKDWQVTVNNQIEKGEGPHSTNPSDRNERQKIRYAVLNWRKETDCPSRAQLHPELNFFHSVTKDGGELVKTCRIEPVSSKRPKGASDKKAGEKRRREEDFAMIKDVRVHEETHASKAWELTLPIDPSNPPVIIKMGNFWELVQYKTRLLKTGEAEAPADEDDGQEDL